MNKSRNDNKNKNENKMRSINKNEISEENGNENAKIARSFEESNINEKCDNKNENCKSPPQNKIISPKSVFETLAVINGISSFSVNILQEGVIVLIVDDLNIQPVMVSKIVCTDTSAVIAVDAMSRLILIADRSSSFFFPSSSSSSSSSSSPSLHPSAKNFCNFHHFCHIFH